MNTPHLKKINIIELASELAHERLIRDWEGEIEIYQNVGEDEVRYTEKAQDLFNNYHDGYLVVIENCQE
jgi:hypothetical protein